MLDHTAFDAPSQSLPVEFQELLKTDPVDGAVEGPNLNSIGPSSYRIENPVIPATPSTPETPPAPVQVLGASLDTVYHNYRVTPAVFDSWRQPLEEHKLLAQGHPERKCQLPGTEFFIGASGRGHHKYILTWPGRGELMINYHPIFAGVRVRLFSSYIASISTYLGAAMAARDLVGALFLSENLEVLDGEQVAELHLAVDFVGLVPHVSDLTNSLWGCKAMPDIEKADFPENLIHSVRWGGHGSDIGAVIYNKSKEIREKSPDKIYMHEGWTANGWDGEQDVYRVEFRFSRTWLRECGINDPVDVDLPALLDFGMQWLKLREALPNDSNTWRWPIALAWTSIREQAIALLGTFWKTYERDYTPSVSVFQLSAQIGGCLACVGALAGALDPDNLWLFVRRVFESRWAKLGVSFPELVEDRRVRYMLPVLQE